MSCSEVAVYRGVAWLLKLHSNWMPPAWPLYNPWSRDCIVDRRQAESQRACMLHFAVERLFVCVMSWWYRGTRPPMIRYDFSYSSSCGLRSSTCQKDHHHLPLWSADVSRFMHTPLHYPGTGYFQLRRRTTSYLMCFYGLVFLQQALAKW